MSRICEITGKKPLTGNNVSHSKRRTKRQQRPNLHKKRLLNPATGVVETMTVSARGLKTLAKWQKEGKKFDLKNLS